MKKTIILLLLAMSGCIPPKEVSPSSSSGSTLSGSAAATTGKVSFYSKTDLGQGKLYVTINNEARGTISHYHSGGVTCGSSADVNVTLPGGTYPYKVTSDGGGSWDGNVKITNGGCFSLELAGAASGTGSSNPGNTNNGSSPGGNTSTTQTKASIGFFIDRDLKTGNIAVYVDNQLAGIIDKYYITTPNCHNNFPLVNASLSPGTHTWHATSNGNYEWKPSIFIVDAGKCYLQKLTL